MARRRRLPGFLRSYFWEYDVRKLSFEDHAGFIIRRIVSVGGPDVVAWLRDHVGDDAIRDQIVACKARGMSYSQVSQWIPRELYEAWASDRPPSLWDNR